MSSLDKCLPKQMNSTLRNLFESSPAMPLETAKFSYKTFKHPLKKYLEGILPSADDYNKGVGSASSAAASQLSKLHPYDYMSLLFTVLLAHCKALGLPFETHPWLLAFRSQASTMNWYSVGSIKSLDLWIPSFEFYDSQQAVHESTMLAPCQTKPCHVDLINYQYQNPCMDADQCLSDDNQDMQCDSQVPCLDAFQSLPDHDQCDSQVPISDQTDQYDNESQVACFPEIQAVPLNLAEASRAVDDEPFADNVEYQKLLKTLKTSFPVTSLWDLLLENYFVKTGLVRTQVRGREREREFSSNFTGNTIFPRPNLLICALADLCPEGTLNLSVNL